MSEDQEQPYADGGVAEGMLLGGILGHMAAERERKNNSPSHGESSAGLALLFGAGFVGMYWDSVVALGVVGGLVGGGALLARPVYKYMRNEDASPLVAGAVSLAPLALGLGVLSNLPEAEKYMAHAGDPTAPGQWWAAGLITVSAAALACHLYRTASTKFKKWGAAASLATGSVAAYTFCPPIRNFISDIPLVMGILLGTTASWIPFSFLQEHYKNLESGVNRFVSVGLSLFPVAAIATALFLGGILSDKLVCKQKNNPVCERQQLGSKILSFRDGVTASLPSDFTDVGFYNIGAILTNNPRFIDGEPLLVEAKYPETQIRISGDATYCVPKGSRVAVWQKESSRTYSSVKVMLSGHNQRPIDYPRNGEQNIKKSTVPMTWATLHGRDITVVWPDKKATIVLSSNGKIEGVGIRKAVEGKDGVYNCPR